MAEPSDVAATTRETAGRGNPEIPDEQALRAKLADASVVILGCGGLGSNAAAMLLRSGVKGLTLVDFDSVEESNLNRQLFFRDQIGRPKTECLAETLLRIDPEARLTLVHEVLTPENLAGIVRGHDVIIEAVDGAEAKAMILDVCCTQCPDTPLVTASGLAGVAPANQVVTQRLADNVYVVGDLESDVRDGHPLLASRVMVAAAHEAHAAIRLILGYSEP